jgi:signal transduction histidine kinase
VAGLGGQLAGVRWWRVFALGAGAATTAFALMYLVVNLYYAGLSIYFGGDVSVGRLREDFLQPFANFMARGGGLPTLFAVLTAGAASLLTRASGAANGLQGLLLGLVSAATIQLIGRAFGPFAAWELVVYPLLGMTGGWLGVVLSRGALERQESLYRATGALYSVEDPRDVAAAVGQYLAGPEDERVSLWRVPSRAEDDGGVWLEPLGDWAPTGSRAWPEGRRLDAERLPSIATLGPSSHTILREDDLPPAERRAWGDLGLRSALLVPLNVSGGPDGLLVVSSRRGRSFFDRRKVRSYLTVGAQAALALENLRLIEEARRSGMIGERRRLAREIHDTLIQGFASIVVNLEAAEGSLGASDGPFPRHVDEARATARESLSEARRIVWALRPGALDGAPLPDALSRLAARWSKANGVTADVAVTGESVPLPTEMEVTLLRVAQEALNNVGKHAGARRTVLTLSYMGDRVTLDVMDDGVGFDPDGAVPEAGLEGGFGLRAMRERVEGAGGSLLVESEPGGGTTLAAGLPVAARDAKVLEAP